MVGDVALVEELLKAGANVHARSSDGVTPLQDAVASGHCEVKLRYVHLKMWAVRQLKFEKD